MKPLTDEQRAFCETWMASYQKLTANLTDDRFTVDVMRMMIRYEMMTRQRKTVLDRLFARYFKVRKAEALGLATRWMRENKAELFIHSLILTDEKEDKACGNPS